MNKQMVFLYFVLQKLEIDNFKVLGSTLLSLNRYYRTRMANSALKCRIIF